MAGRAAGLARLPAAAASHAALRGAGAGAGTADGAADGAARAPPGAAALAARGAAAPAAAPPQGWAWPGGGVSSVSALPAAGRPRAFSSTSSGGDAAGAGASTSGGTTLLQRERGGGLGPSGRRLEPSADEVRAALAHCAQMVRGWGQAVPARGSGWGQRGTGPPAALAAAQCPASLANPRPRPRPPAPTPGPKVSQHDGESLAWVTLLPRDLRARVLALRAFNLEALLVGEAVRSKERAMAAIRWGEREATRSRLAACLLQVGLGRRSRTTAVTPSKPALPPPLPPWPRRFQWWRDAIGQLFSGAPPPAHPVLTALWAASKGAKLGRYRLRRIIDTREEEFMR
jgi:hypothetical protein